MKSISPSGYVPVSYGPTCPLCHSTTNRIPRRFIDLLHSIFVPVRRYRCRSLRCNWEGNLRTDSLESHHS